MSNWEIVTGEDGEQYYQFEGQVFIAQPGAPPPLATRGYENGALGPAAAYTIEQLLAMKAAADPSPLLRLQRQQAEFIKALTTWPTWPNPLLPDGTDLTLKAETWLPGDPTTDECSEPEHGRFQNLEWEDES